MSARVSRPIHQAQLAAAHERCRAWNLAVQPGALVRFWVFPGVGPGRLARTMAPAQIAGPTAVVMINPVRNRSGAPYCVGLNSVRPEDGAEEEEACRSSPSGTASRKRSSRPSSPASSN